MLETVGRIVGRMAELKGMATQDLSSSQDVESYNNEFADLQKQLFDISKTTFNGVSLFADFVSDGNGGSGSTQTQFKGSDSLDHTIDIYTSSEGSSGTKVSLYKSALLSALTIDASALTTAQDSAAGANGTTFGLFLDSSAEELPFLSMRVDYQWACSNRQFPILHIFEHSQVAACPD